MHATIKTHPLTKFKGEPLSSYKRVKRTHTMRGEERERCGSSIELRSKGNESRGHVRPTSIRGDVVIVCWDVDA